MKPKAIFNWSGGKDSALSLYKIQSLNQYEITCLLTTLNKEKERISMHGVREVLLEQQAASTGIALQKVFIPEIAGMEEYEAIMASVLDDPKFTNIQAGIFGDIFLEDLRKYRERQLSRYHIQGVFPLWGTSTKEIVNEFLQLGFKAVVTCVHEKFLDKSFAGRIIDTEFLKDLPANVDPCGENGEFHSFVFDGPVFSSPICYEKGEIVYKKYLSPSKSETDTTGTNITDPYEFGFWYCDLLPC